MKFIVFFVCILSTLCYDGGFDYVDFMKDLLKEEDEVTDVEYFDFMKNNPDYGYNGKLDEILEKDMQRARHDAYLDYTGAGVYRKSQLDSVVRALSNNLYGNTHSINPSSIRTSRAVNEARDLVLNFFNTTQAEYQVIFTSGATAALRLVADSFPWTNRSRYLYLQENHNSVLGIREIASEFGAQWKSVPPDTLPTKTQCELQEKDINPYRTFNTTTIYSLFAYPAEDNFAGVKYPLEWIEAIHKNTLFQCDFERGINHEWKVLLDAAAFAPTQRLDLYKYKPDFVTLSFYKMFGFPTGLGALIVRNDMTNFMRKRYFGGGTVVYASEESQFCLFHAEPCAKFEDGTINFLNIAALRYGYQSLNELGIDNISKHVHSLTSYLYTKLTELKHSNGQPLCEIYGKHYKNDSALVQGPIVAMNLKYKNGSYIGYHGIQIKSAKQHIHFRTGCNCNPGACRHYLNVTDELFKQMARTRTSCADETDIIEGKATGAVRISMGYLTSYKDIRKLLDFLESYLE